MTFPPSVNINIYKIRAPPHSHDHWKFAFKVEQLKSKTDKLCKSKEVAS